MIKTVVDLKGQKRFKKKGANEITPDDLPVDMKNASNAKEIFRKLTTTTSYAKTFGDKPKAEQDFSILNKKPFDQLPIVQILRPNVQQYLSRWLKINDQDKFTGRIYFTVREMYTVVKNQLAEVPTSHESHATLEKLNVSAPRFDKMIQSLSEKKRGFSVNRSGH